MRSSKMRVAALAAALAAGVPAPGSAHLVQTGFGSFYDGIAHLFVTPADLLLVLSLALLAGARGRGAARRTLVVLPIAWLAGGASGAWLHAEVALSWPTTLSFALTGALIALAPPVPPAFVAAWAGLGGYLHGFANGAAMTTDRGKWLGLAGIVLAVFTLVPLVAAPVVAARREWVRIAVRVVGSWIAAIGLLMMGWLLAGDRIEGTRVSASAVPPSAVATPYRGDSSEP